MARRHASEADDRKGMTLNQGVRRGQIFRVGLLFVIFGASMVIGGGAARATSDAHKFCMSHTLRDFERPLREFLSVKHLPGSGILPIGPKGLRVNVFNQVQAGSGSIGFVVEKSGGDGSRWDGWRSTVELQRVGSGGEALINSGVRKRIARLAQPDHRRDMIFKVSGKPAFYRATIEFGKESELGGFRYTEYFRVVDRRIDIRLKVQRAEYHTGEVTLLRLENFGSVSFVYGGPFVAERYDGNAWSSAPGVLPPPYLNALGVGMGTSGACLKVPLAKDLLPGRYRIVQDVHEWPQNGPRIYVSTEFDVLP